MPRYDFRCKNGHVSEYVLPIEKRDKPLRERCRECKGALERIFTPPAIMGEHEAKTFYEHEREAWALATGQQHQTAGELKDWCAANGKTIVDKGFKPKKPEDFSEKQALDALGKIYDENHSLGSVNTGGGS